MALRSISANAPSIWSKARPAGVVVSMGELSARKPMLRDSRSSMSEISSAARRSKGTNMNTRNYLQTILGILLLGHSFFASSQDYWVDIGSVEAEEQDGVVLVPVRINKITDQGFTAPEVVGSGDNVSVWYSTYPYVGGEINTVPGEDYQDKSGWLRFQPGDSEKFIRITLIDDNEHEEDERVIISLSFANDAEQSTSTDGKASFQSSQGHVTILNNDCSDETVRPSCRLPVATTVLDIEANEGTNLEISVTLDAPVRADTTFTYTLNLADEATNTDVDLADGTDFNPDIDTTQDTPPTGSIIIPGGSTEGSLTLSLRKGDGYEKLRETFTVTLEATGKRIRRPTLADGDITASIINVDGCERGIDDGGDSGICRLYPEVILGHHTLSAKRKEGEDQRFGGRGRRNTAPSYFDEDWDDPLKINWSLVPDTALAGADYTGSESGTLNIRNTARSFEGHPYWGSSAFLIPTVNRQDMQGPRTFYVEVTPHQDNPELLIIVPNKEFNGPTDGDFWDFDQATGCDTDPCRFPITFGDRDKFPGKLKLISPGKAPEYSGLVVLAVGLDELSVPHSSFAANEMGERYTPILLETFDTGSGDGFARGGPDYTYISTRKDFILGEGSASITVPIASDDGYEGDEEFGYRATFLDWDDAPLVGTVIILDDAIESGARIAVDSHHDRNGDEGSRLEIGFQIIGDSHNPRTYDVEVFTETLGTGTGYANNADFTPKSRTFTVTGQDGAHYTSFFVDILEDRVGEPAEKFGVVLRLKKVPDLATRSAAVTLTIRASDEGKSLNVDNNEMDEVACIVPDNACSVDDEMIGVITAVTETADGTERSVYVDAIAGGNCCAKCADDPIVGSNVILETMDNGLWISGLTGGIVDADVGEYLRTLQQQTTDSCTITVGVQLTYPYEDQPLYILDLEPEEATVDEGESILLTATLDPAQGELLPFYLETISRTATIHKDFVDTPLTNFEFAIGETEVEYSILTLVDSEDEGDEVFDVHLGKDGVNFAAIYSTITIIDDSADNTTDGGSRGDGGMIDKVSETLFTYTDNVDGSIHGERANLAGQYEFLLNDTTRAKRPNGRYHKLRVADWYTVTTMVDAFALNVEDGDGISLDCPTDLASGQNVEFDWGNGNSVGFYVYGAFVSTNGLRCAFAASPSWHTGNPSQVPSDPVTVTFTPAID